MGNQAAGIQPVLNVALEPTTDQPATLPARQADPALAMIERFAADPNFDVTKLQALMDMREREMKRVAESEFNQAMNRAQKKMRPIDADANNPQTKSKYASYAKLDTALRPIYTDEGFGLSFDTADSPHAEHVRVLCYVTHAAGHSRTYRADMPADGKGAKGGDVMTKTHAAGAAMSYGMRYLLKMIFNIAVGEEDRDGNQVRPDVVAPDGFQAWVDEMDAFVLNDCTRKQLDAKWYEAPESFRKHIASTNRSHVEGWKKKADQVKEPKK